MIVPAFSCRTAHKFWKAATTLSPSSPTVKSVHFLKSPVVVYIIACALTHVRGLPLEKSVRDDVVISKRLAKGEWLCLGPYKAIISASWEVSEFHERKVDQGIAKYKKKGQR